MSTYFDYTATAPVKQHVLEHYYSNMRKFYANPSSKHLVGIDSNDLIEEAKKKIAKTLDCKESEIIFTSGGTESINTALKGCAWMLRENAPHRIISTKGEHDAVVQSIDFLKRQLGFETTWIDLEKTGKVNLQQWQEAVSEKDHSIASFIYVSNETGAINDLEQIVKITRDANPRTLIHADVVQAIGKIPFSFKNSDLDFASIAGHKVGAPKSCGLLLARENKHIEPLIHGGGQQEGRRSGTEDAPLYYALAEAIELSHDNIDAAYKRVEKLRKRFIGLLDQFEVPYRIISPDDALALVLTISFPGLRAETMSNALSSRQIYISTGSACHADVVGRNDVLEAMGLDKETIANSCRISFHVTHTSQDIDLLAKSIAAIHEKYARV